MSTSADLPDADATRASLDALEDQQRRTARGLRPHPLGLYLPWGLGYLVAFGAAWLAAEPGALVPGAVATVLIVIAGVVPLVASALTIHRSQRGLSGPRARTAALYGWSWVLGFVALGVVLGRLDALGVPAETSSVLWSGACLVLVGVLFLAGGMLFPGSGQYVLGVWILASAVVAVLVGYPANFLALAVLGGGGMIALAVVTHVRGRR